MVSLLHLIQCFLFTCFYPNQCLIQVKSTVDVNLLEIFSLPYCSTKPQLGHKPSFCSFCQYHWRVVQSKRLAWTIRGFNYSVKLYTRETRSASQTCFADELQITSGFMLGWDKFWPLPRFVSKDTRAHKLEGSCVMLTQGVWQAHYGHQNYGVL